MSAGSDGTVEDSNEALFDVLRRAIRSRRVRLRFTSNPVGPIFEGFYHHNKMAAGAIAALVPVLYWALFVAFSTALWTIARRVPLLAPIAEFFAQGRVIGIPILGICLLTYFAWRRYAVLSDVEVWDCVWRAGALKLTMRARSLSCEAPQDDWRRLARQLRVP